MQTAKRLSILSFISLSLSVCAQPGNDGSRSQEAYQVTAQGTINSVLEITSNNGNNLTTSQNPYPLTGNAPVSVVTVKVNGTPYTATWDFLDPNATPKKPVKWTISVPLNAGANALTVQGFNRLNQLVGSDSITITRSP